MGFMAQLSAVDHLALVNVPMPSSGLAMSGPWLFAHIPSRWFRLKPPTIARWSRPPGWAKDRVAD